jgi:hypothetical protein
MKLQHIINGSGNPAVGRHCVTEEIEAEALKIAIKIAAIYNGGINRLLNISQYFTIKMI